MLIILELASKISVLRVNGNLTRSDWLMQRLASTLNMPVERSSISETCCRGAAIAAGVGAGGSTAKCYWFIQENHVYNLLLISNKLHLSAICFTWALCCHFRNMEILLRGRSASTLDENCFWAQSILRKKIGEAILPLDWCLCQRSHNLRHWSGYSAEWSCHFRSMIFISLWSMLSTHLMSPFYG